MLEGQVRRGRGRPRKYPPKQKSDFESCKYDNFFNNPFRKGEEGIILNVPKLVENVFNFLYLGPYKGKLFSKPQNYEENYILNNLVKNKKISPKIKDERSCDEVFYEYLSIFKNKANEKYFNFILKFILLFRECYDMSKNKNLPEEKREQFTNKISPDGLPDFCNEFYGEFLEPNNFFGIDEQGERNDIIDIIQHFCIWLFKNEYTTSKLSLSS